MEEFKFVLRCLILASLVAIFSQTKVDNQTLEHRASHFFTYSPTAQFVRASAAGGVNLIIKGYNNTSDFIYEKTGRRLSKTNFDARSLFAEENDQANLENRNIEENQHSQIRKRPIHSSPVFQKEQATSSDQINVIDLDKTEVAQ